MTDERPRPQYGEYATPEEQVAAGGIPVAATGSRPRADVGAGAGAGSDGVADAVTGSAARAGRSAAAPAPGTTVTPGTVTPTTVTPGTLPGAAAHAGQTVRGARPNRPWDVAFTVFVLSLNAFTVLTSIPDWLNLGTTMTTAYTQLGYGDYTSIALANSIGLGIVAVQMALFGAALYFGISRLRSQRRGFPIVLGLALLALVVTMVLLIVAMTSDPALAVYINTQSGN